MTSLGDGNGSAPSGPEGDTTSAARTGRPAAGNGVRRSRPAAAVQAVAKQARITRRLAKEAPAPSPVVAAAEESLLTTAQMREAKRLIRAKQVITKKEREFGRRLVATLTEGQNALNIAFGAILSAYIGTVLAAIDDKPFDQWTLAAFFVQIGVFIGGLCIGNLIVLRKHFGLGTGFLLAGAVAAYLSLGTARRLGFELPILRVMYVCWYAMLVATDGLLTAIVFFHHRSVVRRAEST